MHKKVQILGLGPYYLPVVYDILIGNRVTEEIEVFKNIDKDLEPVNPVSDFPYKLHEPDVLVDHQYPCVFGVSGAENKIPVFNFFCNLRGVGKTNFLNVKDASAVVSINTRIGLGCFIEQNVSVSAQTIIGFGVSIKRNASIGHHCKIGDFVDINPGAVISGKVTIGNHCTIGVGAVILDGIEIGENSIIGGGSVVTKDIPPGVVAFGSPCKVIRQRSDR